jgi:hypothetical protein
MSEKFYIDGYDAQGNIVGVSDDGVEQTSGELRPMAEGVPLPPDAEIVQVEAVEGDVLHLKTLYAPHKGPSRASSPKYRAGYDAVFGKRKSTEVN